MRDKRTGGLEREFLSDDLVEVAGTDLDILALHEAIERLAQLDPETAEIAEMRCFGGLQHDEVARVLDCSDRTIERRWRFARTWLQKELAEQD
jgi:RNA polymerase sigma factor (sigma-70 family)